MNTAVSLDALILASKQIQLNLDDSLPKKESLPGLESSVNDVLLNSTNVKKIRLVLPITRYAEHLSTLDLKPPFSLRQILQSVLEFYSEPLSVKEKTQILKNPETAAGDPLIGELLSESTDPPPISAVQWPHHPEAMKAFLQTVAGLPKKQIDSWTEQGDLKLFCEFRRVWHGDQSKPEHWGGAQQNVLWGQRIIHSVSPEAAQIIAREAGIAVQSDSAETLFTDLFLLISRSQPDPKGKLPDKLILALNKGLNHPPLPPVSLVLNWTADQVLYQVRALNLQTAEDSMNPSIWSYGGMEAELLHYLQSGGVPAPWPKKKKTKNVRQLPLRRELMGDLCFFEGLRVIKHRQGTAELAVQMGS